MVSSTYLSCKKSEKVVTPIESLKSDEKFITAVKQNAAIIANGRNSQEAISLITKTNPTTADLNRFSALLGFKDFAEYSKFVQKQDAVLLQLKEEYQLDKVNQNTLTNIGIEVLNSYKQPVKLSSLKGSTVQLEDTNNCERIRRNCLVTVAATATAAHIACVAADLTIILGTICHGAAIAYQLAAGDTCNAEAQNCQRLSTPL